MNHAELIARLEAAEVGSMELDVCMWEASDGWKNVHRPPCVTTSLDCALALAVRLFGERNTATMLFIVAGSGDDIKRFPIRICIPILRALDAQEQK